MTKVFKGTYTAIITPFKDGKIDLASWEVLLKRQIDAKIEGVVVLGTTGESPTVTDEERDQLVEAAVKQAQGTQTKIIVGTGSNDTAHTIHLSKKAVKQGANGVLVVNPYYNKPTQEGLYQHFTAVADVLTADCPMMLYNIMGRTGVNVETKTLKRIAEHKHIVAVKEASGNIGQIADVIRELPKDFAVLSGDDNLTFPLMAFGGDGVVSVLSNILPGEVKELVDFGLKGNWDKAREKHFGLLDAMKGIFIETNPIPVKTVLADKGICKEEFRLPMCPAQKETKEKLKKIFG